MKRTFNILKESTIKEYIYENISRNFYGFLKEHNVIYTVNGVIKNSYDMVNPNDVLEVTYDDIEQEGILSDLGIDVVYEDEYYIVVDKGPKVQSIPSKSNPEDSIFNRLLYYFKDTPYTVHLINRLDKETKGLILVAKSNYAAAIIKDFSKVYIAKTLNKLPEGLDMIDLPILKVEGQMKRKIDIKGKKALTLFNLVSEDNDLYTYQVNIKTGRTHQIRLHFSYLGSPLINDTLYGGSEYGDKTLGLVCSQIIFIHPITKEVLTLKSKY